MTGSLSKASAYSHLREYVLAEAAETKGSETVNTVLLVIEETFRSSLVPTSLIKSHTFT